MLKKVQVIMLPASEKSKIRLMKTVGLQYAHDLIFNKTEHTSPQHLYFLSDEEIKEGDWQLEKGTNKVERRSQGSYNKDHYKKIIATTDNLKIHFTDENNTYCKKNLPQPSQSFLKIHVKEYNKGNIIKEVMVEYEVSDNWLKENPPFSGPYPELKSKDYILKINPKDNTITIKRVKESWSREEVEHLTYEAYKVGIKQGIDPKTTPFSEWIEALDLESCR